MNYKYFLVFVLASLSVFINFDVFGQSNQTISKIIFVRHAEKAVSQTHDPELSHAGKERAKKLAKVFEEVQIDAFYATPFIRTRETIAVLAQAQDKKIQTYDSKDIPGFLKIIELEKNNTILVAGHSNTIPTLVNTLIGSSKYADLEESVYDHIWIIIFKGNELIDCSLIKY